MASSSESRLAIAGIPARQACVQHYTGSFARSAVPWRLCRQALALMVVLAAASASEAATGARPDFVAPTVTVTGILAEDLESVPGALFAIRPEDLEAQRPFTVKEAVRLSPGIHVVDEDAFGLNLNIGTRGLNPRRSQRMMLLEDGAPIHLAPYSDPSSHYHPPLERVQRIDILRGSGQIVHGPQTVGGVINFVGEEPPRRFGGRVGVAAGNRDFRSLHANVGTGGEWGGISLSALRKEGDGTREKHHHEVSDLSLRGVLDVAPAHSLFFKLGRYEEDSKTSEAGMSAARYRADAYGNPFNHDRFELERNAAQLVHQWSLSEQATLSTNIYYQKTDRASYRQIDDSDDQMTANPATGCTGGARRDHENFADLCGNKMRPRNYRFFGVEPRLDVRYRAFGVDNHTVAGVRLHHEDITRKRYNGLTPNAREKSPGTTFRDWNDIEADALSAFVQNTFFFGDWTVTPGVRVERIESRNQARRFNFTDVDVTLEDRETTALPGVGVTWYGLPATTVFAGVHRGFAPPRPDSNMNPTDPDATLVEPERSTNYELGLRSEPRPGLRAEATLFRIDFRKQILPGRAVGRPDLTFANAGTTRHDGLELAGRVDFGTLLGSAHNVYVSAAYTNLFTARFDRDQFNEDVNVRGNRLPYAPRHLLNASIGYEHAAGFDARLGVEYVSRQFADDLNTRAPSEDGQTGVIPSHATLNAAVNYRLAPQGLTFFVSGSNLTNRRYIVSRVDGIQVGRPRQVLAGVNWQY